MHQGLIFKNIFKKAVFFVNAGAASRCMGAAARRGQNPAKVPQAKSVVTSYPSCE
jgi:hypothetical protein